MSVERPTGWTGGQYSLVRGLTGLVLMASHANGLWSVLAGPLDGVEGGIREGAGLLLSIAYLAGFRDRIAAAALLGLQLLSLRWIWTALDAEPGVRAVLAGPLVIHLGLLFLLGLHLLAPPEPYGSFAARGRTDPRGDWRFPPLLMLLARAALGVLIGLKLAGVGAPAVPIWRGGIELGLLALLSADPGWISPGGQGTDLMFYDGACGLCHRSVRFILAEDRAGSAFRFAPIGSPAFQSGISAADRPDLPDSVIIRTADGRTLVRSAAVLQVGERLGGYWSLLAAGFGVLPRRLLDWLYDRVAAVRRRLFARPPDACPLLPPDLRQRFDY